MENRNWTELKLVKRESKTQREKNIFIGHIKGGNVLEWGGKATRCKSHAISANNANIHKGKGRNHYLGIH